MVIGYADVLTHSAAPVVEVPDAAIIVHGVITPALIFPLLSRMTIVLGTLDAVADENVPP